MRLMIWIAKNQNTSETENAETENGNLDTSNLSATAMQRIT